VSQNWVRGAKCEVQLLGTKIFRQCRETAHKNSSLTSRANRQSPIAAVFCSAGASPSHDFAD
jgi:hypothetical protein